jgi:UDP-3-O-[3-hydroxymyristoyl] N-acetylglucosamine deacetylase
LLFQQTSLRAPYSIEGVGMHTGAEARITVKPAPANSGIHFVVGAARIPARAAFVVNTRRCTCLGNGDKRVDTVEHLLSALFGLCITNVEIEVEGPEIPILDGSAQLWVKGLKAAGIVELGVCAPTLRLSEPVALQTGDSWYIAVPSEELGVTCVTHFDHPLLGTETITYVESPDHYENEIAPARTFGFSSEVEALLAAGLARGGSLDNALIIQHDRFSHKLRLPHECARHKLMDLLGDLSLTGERLCASVTAIKPSHQGNTAFATLLSNYALDN